MDRELIPGGHLASVIRGENENPAQKYKIVYHRDQKRATPKIPTSERWKISKSWEPVLS